MKLKYRKLIAISLTALILLFIFRLMFIFNSTINYKNHQIKEYNLEEIMNKIDESGVDKGKLSMVLREEVPIGFHYIFYFIQCLLIVWIYNKLLNKMNKRSIFTHARIDDNKNEHR